MTSDHLTNLIDRYNSGDAAAFDAIYAATCDDFYRYAKRLTSNEALIDDAIQDTYIKIAANISALRNPSGFASWGRAILRNNINDAFRRDRHSVLMTSGVDEEGNESNFFDNLENDDRDYIPGEGLDRREVEQIIRRAMEELSDVQRQTLTYFYYDEMSIADIAALMDCSEGTVKSRLNSGRAKLRLVIATYEEESGVRIHAVLPFALIASALKAADTSLVIPPASSVRIIAGLERSLSGVHKKTSAAAGRSHNGVSSKTTGIKRLARSAAAATFTVICAVSLGGAGAIHALTGTFGFADPGSADSSKHVAESAAMSTSCAAEDASQTAASDVTGLFGGSLGSLTSVQNHFTGEKIGSGDTPAEAVSAVNAHNDPQVDYSAGSQNDPSASSREDTPSAADPISYETANNSANFICGADHNSQVINISGTVLACGFPNAGSVALISNRRAELFAHIADGTVSDLTASEDTAYCVVGSSVYSFGISQESSDQKTVNLLFSENGPVSDLTIVGNTMYYTVDSSIFRRDLSSGDKTLFASGLNGFYCCDNSYLYGISDDEIIKLSLSNGSIRTIVGANGANALMLDNGTLYYGYIGSQSAQPLYSVRTNGTEAEAFASLPASTQDVYVNDGNVYTMSDSIVYKNGSPLAMQFAGKPASMLGADGLKVYARSSGMIWEVSLSDGYATISGYYE